jgi:hypothetical protein
MLVCHVSLRPPRSAIAADVAETATAADTSTIGNIIFATLVDDPASVGELVDAYLGEIMLEAASAVDVADSGLAYATAIDETGTAASLQDASTVSTANTWNASDAVSITLSGGNLTATSTTTTAGVRHTTGHSSGKYYWEVTLTNWNSTSTETGLATSSAALAGGGIAGQAVVTKSVGGFNGSIYINGTDSGGRLGILSNNIVGIAADLTAGLIWFRLAPSGNWNGSGTANPATGAGGISLGALAGNTLLPIFAALSANEDVTGNFGGSAFTGAVPSGFTSGW